ncbi:MAG: thioredoxin domain-containing protein [Caulobacteraceae bacterium]|nr:thioredoxin domain-containing protein [Caulobacteraceae bacterium]
MMRLGSAVALALAALLALGACQPSKDDDAAFGARVKAYLMAHPEVLRAAIDNLQAREDADADKAAAEAEVKAKAALPGLRGALERDPRDFVANPNGKVTVTEFYDYRCPHCINVAPKVVNLIRTRPDVRFVFKEMPIFGPVSEHAARAAMAAKAQGKDYLGLYQAFMSARPLTDAEIDRLAAAEGVDVAAMNAPAERAKAETQLKDVTKLFTSLSLEGTPGFVVGDEIIRGEDYEALTAAIAKAEGKA